MGIDRSIGIDGDLILHKPGSDSRLFLNEVKFKGEFVGGAFPKAKIGSVAGRQLYGEENHEVNLLIKMAAVDENLICDEEKDDMTAAELYFTRWKYLRKLGIPTADSMRIVNQDYVAMGDMTIGGGEFFGKAKRSETLRTGYDEYVLKDMDDVYLRLNILGVERELRRVHQLAWDNGLLLPRDDPFDLLVYPDGSFRILILDLSQMRKVSDKSDEFRSRDLSNTLEDLYGLRSRLLKIKEKSVAV